MSRLNGAVPVNDFFANRLALSPITNLVTPSNVLWIAEATANDEFATPEPGEPVASLSFPSAGKTLWWSWTAPVSGRVQIQILGSNSLVAGFFGGLSLTNLERLPVNGFIPPSEFVRQVVAGESIEILTDRWLLAWGDIAVRVIETPAPVNDLFADRIPVTGNRVTMSGRLDVATIEPGEGQHGSPAPQAQSVWWAWTAPTSGDTTLTISQSGTTTRPRFAVYDGSTLAELGLITNGGGSSSITNVSFMAQAGKTYPIAVATSPGNLIPLFILELTRQSAPRASWTQPATALVAAPGADVPLEVEAVDPDGQVVRVDFYRNQVLFATDSSPPYTAILTNLAFGTHDLIARAIDNDGLVSQTGVLVEVPQSNDDFADRLPLVGFPVSRLGTNAGATHELLEPKHAGSDFLAGSVWYTWTPETNGPVVVVVQRREGAAVLGVYTGDDVGALTLAGSTVEQPGSNAVVRVEATAGVPLRIAVDCTYGFGTTFVLSLIPPPENDHFTNAIVLTGDSFYGSGYTYGSTVEPAEPRVSPFNQHSIWWTWTAPYTAPVRLDLVPTYRVSAQVFSGTSLTNLTRLTSSSVLSPNTLRFSAEQGRVYRFSFDGDFGRMGTLEFRGRPDGFPALVGVTPLGQELRFQLRGLRGRDHQVEWSLNLRDWQFLKTVSLVTTSAVVTVPLNAGSTGGFYRAVMTP